jgi:hypothetical protein
VLLQGTGERSIVADGGEQSTEGFVGARDEELGDEPREGGEEA